MPWQPQITPDFGRSVVLPVLPTLQGGEADYAHRITSAPLLIFNLPTALCLILKWEYLSGIDLTKRKSDMHFFELQVETKKN